MAAFLGAIRAQSIKHENGKENHQSLGMAG